eukprot:5904691-Pleurochrysis_carterae.AAC.2
MSPIYFGADLHPRDDAGGHALMHALPSGLNTHVLPFSFVQFRWKSSILVELSCVVLLVARPCVRRGHEQRDDLKMPPLDGDSVPFPQGISRRLCALRYSSSERRAFSR